jgi:gliding motility-associated-like protein
VLGGAAANSAFEWTITPATGATFAGNINNDSVRVNWLQAGTYTLSVREISAAGCVGEIIDTTIIVNPLPATVLNAYDTLICTESLAARAYSVSGLAGSQYVWTLKGGVFANNDTTGNSVTVNWTANAPEKSLSVREISVAGCSATAILNIPLFYDGSAVSLQQVSLLEDNTSTVEIKFAVQNLASYPVNGTVEILRRAQGTTAWTSVVTLPATITSYQDQPENASSTVYEYQVVGKNRCGADLGSRVHNTVLIKAFALEADRISQLTWNAYNGWPAGAVRYEIYRKLEGGSFESYDNAAGNAQTWERKNASDAFVQCYKIKAISEEGYFSWSNELCINFENKLVIANVITPNGDGKNDAWRIGNIDLYPDSEIKVFNRWGKKVYESKGYDNTWTGDGLEVGTYFYEVISEQKGVKAKGWVEILR